MTVVASGELELKLSPASLAKIEKSIASATQKIRDLDVRVDPAATARIQSALAGAGTPAGAAFGKQFTNEAGDTIRTGTKRSLNDVESDAARSGKDSGKTFGKAFGGALTGVAAFAAIRTGFRFIGDSVSEFAEARRGLADTAAVLKSTGGAAGITAKHVDTLATKLSRVAAVDDDVIRSGENLLLTFTAVRNEAGKGNKVFDRAVTVANDMAAKFGGDLNTSILQVGKALQDPIKGVAALGRAGVSVDELRPKVQQLVAAGDKLGAQRAILRELETEFGGVAKAIADSDGGVRRAAVAFGELKESIGAAVAPAIAQITPVVIALTNAVGGLPPLLTGSALGFFAFIAAAAGIARVGKLVASTRDELVKMGAAGRFAAAGVGAFGKALTIVGFAALEVETVKLALDKLDEIQFGKKPIKQLTKDLAEFAVSGQASTLMVDKFGDSLSDVGHKIELADNAFSVPGLGKVRDVAIAATRDIDALDKALAELVAGGHGDLAAAAFDQITAAAKEQGTAVKDIKHVFNDYAKAVETQKVLVLLAAGANDKLATALGGVADAADIASKSLDLGDELRDFQQSFTLDFIGRNLGAIGEDALGVGIALNTTAEAGVDFSAALEAANPIAAKFAKNAAELALGLESDVVNAFDNATISAEQFSDALSITLDPFEDVQAATFATQRSFENLIKTRKDSTHTALDEKEAVLDLVRAVQDEELAIIANSKGDLTAAQAKDELIRKLEAARDKSGALRGEFDQYIAKINQIPPEKLTEFIANTDDAKGSIAGLTTSIDALVRLLAQKYKINLDLSQATTDADSLLAKLAAIRGAGPVSRQEVILEEKRQQRDISGNGVIGTFARGGPFAANRTILLGEEGPELVRFNRSGTVINNDQTRQILSERSQRPQSSTTVEQHITINEVTADPRVTAFAVAARLGADSTR